MKRNRFLTVTVVMEETRGISMPVSIRPPGYIRDGKARTGTSYHLLEL